MPARSPSRDSSPIPRRRRPDEPDRRPTAGRCPPEAEVEEDPLRLRLDFHGESVLVHDYAGGVVADQARLCPRRGARARAASSTWTAGCCRPDALWWARTAERRARRRLAGAAGLDGAPAGALRRAAAAPAPADAGAGVRLPAGAPGALRLRRQGAAPRRPTTSSTTARPTTCSPRAASARARTTSRPTRPRAGGVLPLLLLGHRRHRARQVAAAPRGHRRRCGPSSTAQAPTRSTTWCRSCGSPTPCGSGRERAPSSSTWSPATGRRRARGLAYDYVVAGDGLYVVADNRTSRRACRSRGRPCAASRRCTRR